MKDISHIFRSYDVRGIYGKDLDEDVMEDIGRAFAQHTKNDVVVARDMRVHSKALCDAFMRGVVATGRNVTFLGVLPLGVGMFRAWGKYQYAYITASHLPKEWNGVKFYHKSGVGFFEKENYAIRDLVLSANLEKSPKEGKVKTEDNKKIIEDYKDYLLARVVAREKTAVTLDCGNGCAGLVVKDLFNRAGFPATTLYEKLDGTFPNRNPEPTEDPLTELRKSKGTGVAYDGDADRMLLVHNGRIIQAEQTAYIILSRLLKTEEGPIIANIESTRLIDHVAKKFNRKVIRVPVGHTFLVQGVEEHKACFGMEVSGHYIIPSIMPIDDSLAVSLYAVKVLSEIEDVDRFLNALPKYPFKRVNVDCDDKKKFRVVAVLREKFKKEYKRVSTIDGVRIDFDNGWILVRASNTSPLIRLSIEGTDERALSELEGKFTEIIQKANSSS